MLKTTKLNALKECKEMENKVNKKLLMELKEIKNKLLHFLNNVDESKEEKEIIDDIKSLLSNTEKTIKEINNNLEITQDTRNFIEKIKEEFFNYDLEIQTPHYYDFGYFFDRKDSGSCYVKLMFELDDLDDIDECVEIALANNALDEEYAGNIVYIEELSEEEARDFGFDI